VDYLADRPVLWVIQEEEAQGGYSACRVSGGFVLRRAVSLIRAGLKADSICYEFSSTWGVFGTVDLTTGRGSSLASYRYFEASLGVYDGSVIHSHHR